MVEGVGCFIIAHKVKHILQQYFPENGRLWRGGGALPCITFKSNSCSCGDTEVFLTAQDITSKITRLTAVVTQCLSPSLASSIATLFSPVLSRCVVAPRTELCFHSNLTAKGDHFFKT